MNEIFASLYEYKPVGFYDPTFSQEIFNAYLYQKYGVVLVISTLLIVLFYYKLLDKPSFAKISVWLIMLIIAVIINFVFLFVDARHVLESAGFEFEGEYLSLAISNGIYCAILFGILSFIIKYFSISNSKVPF